MLIFREDKAYMFFFLSVNVQVDEFTFYMVSSQIIVCNIKSFSMLSVHFVGPEICVLNMVNVGVLLCSIWHGFKIEEAIELVMFSSISGPNEQHAISKCPICFILSYSLHEYQMRHMTWSSYVMG